MTAVSCYECEADAEFFIEQRCGEDEPVTSVGLYCAEHAVEAIEERSGVPA